MASLDFLSLYHKLPYFLRVCVASSRGYYLSSWRYSKKTPEWIAETLARDSWSAEQWATYHKQELEFLLHRAATKVPYYREYWQPYTQRSTTHEQPWLQLQNWPILSKKALRNNPEAFLVDGCHTEDMFPEHTSGTTGTPLHLWFRREHVQYWFAVFEARIRHWNNLSIKHNRWGILGGQLVAPPNAKKPPFWVWNQGLNQLYMSTYHLTDAYVAAYIQAIKNHRLTHIIGYPSAIFTLARMALAQELAPPPIQVIFSNAEPLYPHQRSTIEQFFNCPIRDTYGLAEMTAAASECEHGTLHLWPDTGIVEIVDEEGNSVPAGETGRLITTGLINSDMPLIRYDTGDQASLSASTGICACGRKLPSLEKITGRSDDMIVTPDGRHVGRLDPIFKASLPIQEAQIIQESLDLIRVKVVPDNQFTKHSEEELIDLVQQRLGNIQVKIEQVSEIPRTKNGKFRAVVSKLKHP